MRGVVRHPTKTLLLKLFGILLLVYAFVNIMLVGLQTTLERNSRFIKESLHIQTKRVPYNTYRYESETQHHTIRKDKGLGAMGAKVVVGNLTDDMEYIKKRNESLKYGMNIFVSDLIGFLRTLADRRPQTCKMIVYPDNLPTVSIIIIFRDEPLSTLMRTVYGVFDTCPKELLQEVILVDDGTVDRRTILGVNIHVRNMDKVILIRNEKSRGLMMARQQGIERARSGHFVVLDSHIEFNIGWLEPILHRLVEEPKALLTSHVGVIDMETFEYLLGELNIQFMCFEQISAKDQWTYYSEEFMLKRNGSVAPIEYCMVPGMMMAMKKDFFLQLGGFDPGMEVWGSENTEMSVKTWLCGGRVEMVPCSKIAHLYRMTPWQGVEKRSTYLFKNLLRFASVWTDGIIQKIMLDNLKSGKPEVDYGDVSARREIREVNECKKYEYFVNKIKEISHEVYFPQNPQRYGPIVNKGKNKCIDCANLQDFKTQTLILYACTTGGNQYFLVSEDGRMKNKASWIMADYAGTLFIAQNPRNWWRNPENQWTLLPNGAIMHNVSGKCLDYDEKEHITLNLCDDRRPQQIWEWPLFNTR